MLSAAEQEQLIYDWDFWSRPEQRQPKHNPNSPDGKWRTWLLLAGRGFGKQVDIQEVVPTPAGWSKVIDLKPGDRLFDADGFPCSVVAVHPVDLKPESYRLHFSDGSTIDACADHLWTTWTHRDRKEYLRLEKQDRFFPDWALARYSMKGTGTFGPEVRTTRQIRENLQIGPRGDTNHSIPTAFPIACATQDLPVDPYVLGYWIGNGHLGRSQMTAGSYKGDFDDNHVIQKIADAGYETSIRRLTDQGQTYINVAGLIGLLRKADVAEKKRIPGLYQRVSIGQRLQLLRGICDSDGHAVSSHVEVCTSSSELAQDIHELVIGLGEKATIAVGEARIGTKSFGEKFRICWTPARFNPFSLPRKADKAAVRPGLRIRERMIVSVEPIDPKPMRCITVDSPSGLFLIGRHMIPTHNTRTAAEWIREEVESGRRRNLGLIGPNKGDVRKIMIEGPSGIMRVCPPWNMPTYEPTNDRIVWPNGASCLVFSAEEPESLRGPNLDGIWCDELCSWGPPQHIRAVYEMAGFCLRIKGPKGDAPCEVITTTPKPSPILREIKNHPLTVAVGGSTMDNLANLDDSMVAFLKKKYEGTRLGRQELYGELLDAFEGALWTPEQLEADRCKLGPGQWTINVGGNSGDIWLAGPRGEMIYFERIVVSIDPAGSASRKSNETGIVVVGLGDDGQGYVLADKSGVYSPEQWAMIAVELYEQWQSDRILAEQNYGGDMVKSTIWSVAPNVPVRMMIASRGKRVRAEPVSALYEQHRIHHVGALPKLEDQMVTWDPFGTGDSPDRMDALVWAITDLMLKKPARQHVQPGYRPPISIYRR